MKIFDKVCGKIGLSNPDSEELREDERQEETEEPRLPRPDNVVNINAAVNNKFSRMKVVVIEPRSFDDVQQVANCLKEKKPVVINFENTDAEDAKRIIDFISGTTYALAGDIKKVGRNVFLCAPNNVNVAYTQERSTGAMDLPWMKK
ncbi:MAG: cell division protein SepF [Schwartzia sp. (in: firmicutes)]